ncbi:tyrosine-type recombinase/integrase [Bacteroides stercoris]|mgnify:FL=1|uniref:Putative site-specific tyrosine recombinase, XerC-like n=1 Tax=Bacteroides stercoris TaxID=46506 RepID=A0A108T2Y5_BACSE|nr:tyrosine-type recombinase/integrase [Bacteroides stercoris]KWR52352.1 putative site-specific tyrosine recombinase, XerC-like [Bacteroides stercoris]MDC2283165.1 tyrosine-type recombinase/integrase [Bacteroides stercoris]MDC2296819.1 tyrosine-type recombinase/integrase [Bacteroides stercoris]DAN58340.1 MAG TPA: site specific tyrosine recombinase [Caudoviricetes sp.]
MAKKNQLTKSDYLPMEDYKKLLYLLHKDRQYLWELYARLAFCTALRVSDILPLTWSDILHKGSLTKSEKKTGKVRKIPFNLNIQTRIEELYMLLKRPNPNELIFKSKFTGTSISPQYLNRIMKEWKIKYKLNIENFSTHTFRKTFGRYVYDTSENKSEALLLLNRIFNHSSVEITKVYICIRKDEINSIFDSIRF